MANIKFSKNHNNKLYSDIFTTIRLSNPEKKKYYEGMQHREFDVMLKQKIIGQAVLVDVICMEFCDISRTVLILDTGILEYAKIFSLFQNFGVKSGRDEMLILIFKTCSFNHAMFPKKNS